MCQVVAWCNPKQNYFIMIDFLNCCSRSAPPKEPRVEERRINNIYYAPQENTNAKEKTRFLQPSFTTSEEFDPAGFILEWLRESTKDIKNEIQKLEQQIAAQNNNIPLLTKQKALLEDVQTFILGKSQNDYNSVAIRLENATSITASELEKIVKTPLLEAYSWEK